MLPCGHEGRTPAIEPASPHPRLLKARIHPQYLQAVPHIPILAEVAVGHDSVQVQNRSEKRPRRECYRVTTYRYSGKWKVVASVAASWDPAHLLGAARHARVRRLAKLSLRQRHASY